MNPGRAVVVSAARTAIGNFGGALKDMDASTLGGVVVREALERCAIPPDVVDEVIMGNVYQAGGGPNPARIASVRAGLPYSVPAMTVNKVCGSGLKSIVLACQAVSLGDAGLVVAGGMESMSRAPYLVPDGRWGARMGHGQLIDSMIRDGLWDCFYDYHMGTTAENLARQYEISRAEQDRYALQSQSRYLAAFKRGIPGHEIVPVTVPQRKGVPVEFTEDEYPRPDANLQGLAGLKPAFVDGGTVTAGNASGISDGAAAVVVTNEQEASRRDLEPLAWVRGYAVAGVDPSLMGIGPAEAIRKLLARSSLEISDIDLIEVNEAFAAQVLAVGRELEWDEERLNVNGGAIAMGHPIGASGTRIVVTLLHEMRRRNVRLGLAGLCIGGGMGLAVLFERR